MGIYTVTVIISVFLAHLAEVFKSKSNSNKEISSLNPLFFWLLNIFLVLVSGFRYMNYYLGDEWNYRNNFDRLIDTSLNFQEIIGIEGGNYFFTWVLANIFNNSQAYIFFSSLITNLLIVRTLARYARPFSLSIFLYIAGGFFFSSMNISRQYIATAIIFYGIKYIINKQFWKYLVTVIIAASFHFSAWILLPLYFVVKKENLSKSVILVFIIGIFIMANFEKVAGLLLPGTPYDSYLGNINSGGYGVSFIRVAIWMVPYSIIIIYREKLLKYLYIKPVFFNMLYFSMVIQIVSLSYVYIHRFDVYFSLYSLILIPKIPLLFEKRQQNLLMFAMLVLFFIFGSYQMWDYPTYHNIIFENIDGILYS